MSQTILKPLGRGIGTGGLVSIYTAPAGTRALLKAMTVSNPTGGALTLIIQVMQDAALDAGVYRNAVPGLSLASMQTYVVPELINQILNATGQIKLQGNGLEYLLSGAEIVQ